MHTALLVSKAGLKIRCFDLSQILFVCLHFFLSTLETSQLLILIYLKRTFDFSLNISRNRCEIHGFRPQIPIV